MPLKTKENPNGLYTELEMFDLLAAFLSLSLVSAYDLELADPSLIRLGMVDQLSFRELPENE